MLDVNHAEAPTLNETGPGGPIDPMQARWGALRASLALGLIRASWHYIALFQLDRSAAWIAWWTLGTVSARVIIVWLYNNTGKSVFVAALAWRARGFYRGKLKRRADETA